MMSDVLYSGRKSQSFQLRLPARMKEEIRRVAEMDGILSTLRLCSDWLKA